MIDLWTSESAILLSPFLPAAEKEEMLFLKAKAPNLHGHVWIASSGSSTDKNCSVKLITLSKQALQTSAAAVNRHLQSHSKDIWIQALPSFHVGGLGVYVRAELCGAKVVEGLGNNRWNAQSYVDQALAAKATLSALVPTQVFDLVRGGFRAPPSLRAIVVGGAALSQELYSRARDLNWPLLPSYGLTECSSQVATASLDSVIAPRSSYALPPLKILDHVKCRKGEGDVLEISSKALLSGWIQRVNEAITFTDLRDKEWFRTQDIVEIQQGALQFFGRTHEFVKILGEGVYIPRVEERCKHHLAKKNFNSEEFCVLAHEEERRGYQLILVTENQNFCDKDFQDLQMSLGQESQSVEVPTVWRRTTVFPRSALGKILKPQVHLESI